MRNVRNRRKAFNLLELLVVIVLLLVVVVGVLVCWIGFGHIEPAVNRTSYINEAYTMADDMGNKNNERDSEDLKIILDGVDLQEDCTMEDVTSRQLKKWVKENRGV
jgi:prepilin-type N-terminal cleavage/methylation domain-containing protein